MDIFNNPGEERKETPLFEQRKPEMVFGQTSRGHMYLFSATFFMAESSPSEDPVLLPPLPTATAAGALNPRTRLEKKERKQRARVQTSEIASTR
jgi:hypothetical protein